MDTPNANVTRTLMEAAIVTAGAALIIDKNLMGNQNVSGLVGYALRNVSHELATAFDRLDALDT